MHPDHLPSVCPSLSAEAWGAPAGGAVVVASLEDLRERLEAMGRVVAVRPAGVGPGEVEGDGLVLIQEARGGASATMRLWPDRDPRVLLARECPGGSWTVLGAPPLLAGLPSAEGPEPRTSEGGCLLVLDIDGVLIDVGRSFHEAVARALAEVRPALAWTDDHFNAFKRLGGFNNDFRLAAAAMELDERGQLDRIWTNEGGFPELEAVFHAREPEAQRRVQAHYQVTRSMERPFVALEDLMRIPAHVAILTGRPPEELGLAFEVLGFELPAVCDSAPHLRKPEPAGLLQLADAYGADRILFVGDTRDDALCLARARNLRPDLTWTFGGVGPDRGRFLGAGDLEAPTLPELLPRLCLTETWGRGGAHDRSGSCGGRD